MNKAEIADVWACLAQGKPLLGLGLGLRNGRVDLSGFSAPEPYVGRRLPVRFADVTELKGLTVLKGVEWKSLDFSGSRLNALRLFDCEISDCIFDRCRCRDWRLWGTAVVDSSFRFADLRDSALGSVVNGKRSTFRNIDFTGADLRQTAYNSAVFVDCTFRDTQLTKVDFEGSSFTDCSFEGELWEVVFNRQGFGTEGLAPNEMKNVDFSRAKLRLVEFRGLNLDRVRFPTDDEHILLPNYPETLDRLLQALKVRSDTGSKMLAAVMSVERKWVGQDQRQGVINKNDIVKMIGEEGLGWFLELLYDP